MVRKKTRWRIAPHRLIRNCFKSTSRAYSVAWSLPPATLIKARISASVRFSMTRLRRVFQRLYNPSPTISSNTRTIISICQSLVRVGGITGTGYQMPLVLTKLSVHRSTWRWWSNGCNPTTASGDGGLKERPTSPVRFYGRKRLHSWVLPDSRSLSHRPVNPSRDMQSNFIGGEERTSIGLHVHNLP